MTADYSLGRLNYAYVDKLFSYGGTRICNLVITFMGSKEVNLIASNVLQPNARRMAACWNAFEGMPTERIEKLPADWAERVTAFLLPNQPHTTGD